MPDFWGKGLEETDNESNTDEKAGCCSNDHERDLLLYFFEIGLTDCIVVDPVPIFGVFVTVGRT